MAGCVCSSRCTTLVLIISLTELALFLYPQGGASFLWAFLALLHKKFVEAGQILVCLWKKSGVATNHFYSSVGGLRLYICLAPICRPLLAHMNFTRFLQTRLYSRRNWGKSLVMFHKRPHIHILGLIWVISCSSIQQAHTFSVPKCNVLNFVLIQTFMSLFEIYRKMYY